MKTVILVSISGGKDSLAAYFEAVDKYKHKYQIVPYFCDTNWEHELTYEYLNYLEVEIGKIVRLKSDKYYGFEDMCISRKTFPSRIRRFCTEELKIFPSVKFMREWKSKGYRVINVVGVRKEESEKRKPENMWKTTFLGILPSKKSGKKAREKFYDRNNTVTTFQPVVYWNTFNVFASILRRGYQLNPLYKMGYTRVGCYPCIQANVTEIGMLDQKTVDRVSTLENSVNSVSTKKNAVFWNADKKMIPLAKQHTRKKYNTLGLDLGCINQFGVCE